MNKDLLKKVVECTRLPSVGRAVKVVNTTIYDNVRKRLNLTKEQLPDKLIKETMLFLNEQLTDFIFENPEGIQITVGNNMHGVLAISKHLPKEMRSDKFEKLEQIENYNMPQWKKDRYIKRYSTDLERRKTKDQKADGYYNAHSFFYTYRMMWFNHRNCKIKKARVYEFQSAMKSSKRLFKLINEGQDYFEWNFHDFYRYKVKSIL